MTGGKQQDQGSSSFPVTGSKTGQDAEPNTGQPDDKGSGGKGRNEPLYILQDHQHTSPVSFAHQVLGVELWSKQLELLETLANNPRVAVKSGNGLGKGF